jgi:death on curing protein
MIKYLTKKQIIKINKSTVELHGGNFNPPSNFLQEENLDYLIDAVSAEMFGEPMYPKLSDKAALYCYNIICNHIFSDGNKRTGLETALFFLEINNFELKFEVNNSVLTAFILKIAEGKSSLDETKDWFEANIVAL